MNSLSFTETNHNIDTTKCYHSNAFNKGLVPNSTEEDVFSFGIVMWEILTGKCVSLEEKIDYSDVFTRVVMQTNSSFEDNITIKIVNESLPGNVMIDKCWADNLELALELSKLAIKCLHINPKKRPVMSDMVKLLKEKLNILYKYENVEPNKAFEAICLVCLQPCRTIEGISCNHSAKDYRSSFCCKQCNNSTIDVQLGENYKAQFKNNNYMIVCGGYYENEVCNKPYNRRNLYNIASEEIINKYDKVCRSRIF